MIRVNNHRGIIRQGQRVVKNDFVTIKRIMPFLVLFAHVALYAGTGENGTGARPLGMGGAFAAVSDDYNSALFNPAGLDRAERNELAASYGSITGEVSRQSVSGVFPTMKSGGFGLNFDKLDLGSFERRDSSGNKIGQFERQETHLTFSYGKRLKNVFIGGSLKYIDINLTDVARASGFSFDAGAIVELNKNISLGLALRDPQGIELEDNRSVKQKIAEPALRAGIAVRTSRQLLLAADYEKSEESGNSFSAGAELDVHGIIFRAGDTIHLDGGNLLSGGLGIRILKDSRMDYAAVYSPDLELRHTLSLYFGFGKSRKDIEDRKMREAETELRELEKEKRIKEGLKKAADLMMEGRWDEAVQECRDALLINPENSEARSMLADAMKQSGLLNLAVIDFTADPPVSAYEAASISNFLRGTLVESGNFKIIDRQNMEVILAEHGIQQTGCTTEECAVQIGKLLNVRRIITGSCGKLGGWYIVIANIIDVETARFVSTKKVSLADFEPDTVDAKIEALKDLLVSDLLK